MFEKVSAVLAARSMEDLVKDFEVTEEMKISCELAEVRGWLMNEMERRNPDAFWKWIDEGYEKSPREYMLQ